MHGTAGGMDLNEMLVFARVVQPGSFTTAAADLGINLANGLVADN
jgi:hypothetical protein